MINIFLVDDLPDVRQMIKMRLALEPDMQIVGEAERADKALELVPQLKPDVVIMDIRMPEVSGIEATQALKEIAPQSPVVVLSLYDDPNTRSQAKAAGAVAFIAKQDPEEVLLAAIRHAASKN